MLLGTIGDPKGQPRGASQPFEGHRLHVGLAWTPHEILTNDTSQPKQGTTSGTPFTRETVLVLRGMKSCEVLGDGMLNPHREVVDREVSRTATTQFIFSIGTLRNDSQGILR